MHEKRMMLIGLFVITLGLLGYFLGASITGEVSNTSYCTGEGCTLLCDFTSDCFEEETICCDGGGFGVCMPTDSCEEGYAYLPETSAEETTSPVIEQPLPLGKNDISFYSVLFILSLILGVLYLYNHQKE